MYYTYIGTYTTLLTRRLHYINLPYLQYIYYNAYITIHILQYIYTGQIELQLIYLHYCLSH